MTWESLHHVFSLILETQAELWKKEKKREKKKEKKSRPHVESFASISAPSPPQLESNGISIFSKAQSGQEGAPPSPHTNLEVEYTLCSWYAAQLKLYNKGKTKQKRIPCYLNFLAKLNSVTLNKDFFPLYCDF